MRIDVVLMKTLAIALMIVGLVLALGSACSVDSVDYPNYLMLSAFAISGFAMCFAGYKLLEW